jgi:signal transduction histidine kinase
VSASRVRFLSSIKFKLIGLSAITIGVIVISLTSFLAFHEARTVHEAQATRARHYGEFLGIQARSAVAFSDRETAREVLGSVSADPDVVAVTMFGHDGTQLYQRGTASPWVNQASVGVSKLQVFDIGDRIAVIAPVTALEGPRGVIVVEISTERSDGQLHELYRAVIIGGGIALLLGIVCAWLIGRGVVRRVRMIDHVVNAVGAGEHASVDIDSDDELGSLAKAFNTMLAQLRENANELERRVGDRTSELIEAISDREREMQSRLQAEVELRQAQKLESVGRLASGVAHEINTPIQFVSDSTHFLQDATNDLVRILQALDVLKCAVEAKAPVEQLAAEATALQEELDLAYLLERIPKGFERALEGLNRVAKIVRSMKEFAHPDSSEMTSLDLNAAIESTLTIAVNEYKYVADVETRFGDIPLVPCFAGEINQVVLNIIVNAAHAIGDVVRDTDKRGLITVETRLDDDHVVISISDTGTGILEEVRDRIFDPFFTTKEVGRGTGQGLAIVRSVLDKHKGTVTVDTAMGVGTTFHLRLPYAIATTTTAALAA